jgi:hypothetical protein
MRRNILPDPHFIASPSPGSPAAVPREAIPIATLIKLRQSECERLRARLLELIDRNEQSRRHNRRWLA